MATVSKVNSDLIALETVYKTAQVAMWKVTVGAALTADSQDGTTKVITEGTARKVAQELGTTAMMFQVTDNGLDIIIVGDSHALDADALAARVDQVLGRSDTSVAEVTDFVGITASS